MLRECPIHPELRLRQLEEADLPALVECLNDEEVARNTRTIPFPYTWQDAQGFWQKRQELDRENSGIPTYWVIEQREHGLVGGISVSLMGGLNGHRDEIGYVIGAAWRGRGYATAAVQALTAMQFETRPQLMRLEAWVYAHNPASKRVLEKAGYTVEGYCHSIFLKDNQLLDAWLLARLRGASSL